MPYFFKFDSVVKAVQRLFIVFLKLTQSTLEGQGFPYLSLSHERFARFFLSIILLPAIKTTLEDTESFPKFLFEIFPRLVDEVVASVWSPPS